MAAVTQTRPGARAKARYVRMSASKARVVLNLIRGKRVSEASEVLRFTERLAADPIGKCLDSAVANAEHNEELTADELFISACFADGGPTLKRFRPRARGRAGRINKQTCHITIEVSRFTDDELSAAREREELKDEGRQKRSSGKSSTGGADRSRRVAKSRAAQAGDDDAAQPNDNDVAEDQVDTDEAADEATSADDTTTTGHDAETPDEETIAEVVTDEDPADDAGVKQ